MKSVIVFYLNHDPSVQNPANLVAFFKESNKELLDALREQGCYTSVVMTVNEACRVDKIDLQKPTPSDFEIKNAHDQKTGE